jgi:uncharacterized damage-inducible protein DinB
MKKLIYLLILTPLTTMAQVPTFQQEFGGNLDFHRAHIIQLVNAIPDDKLSWTPTEGVRSVSEVVAHIAASTYNLTSSLGQAIPEGVDPSTFEKTLKTKEALKNAVNGAFDFAKSASLAVADSDLATQVELPFGTFTKRGVMTITLAHDTEHKGQFIAYARMLGVTPPWNAEG